MQLAVVEQNEIVPPEQLQWTALLQQFFDYFCILIIWLFNLICFPFKDFFASVQRASKRDNNNRTPGEGTCFELGNFFDCFFFLITQFLRLNKSTNDLY